MHLRTLSLEVYYPGMCSGIFGNHDNWRDRARVLHVKCIIIIIIIRNYIIT